MRILLIGEYSRLHNSLKEGLQKNGHTVTLIGSGDGYKNFPVDIKIVSTFFESRLLKPLAKLIDKLFNVSLNEVEIGIKYLIKIKNLKNYDIVQLINENALQTIPIFQIYLLKKIITNNKKTFLLSCGTDYLSVKYSLDQKFKYSILTPYLNDKKLKKEYKHILKYTNKGFIKLHKFIFENVSGIISSDLDYHIPLSNNEKYLGMIPNPINIELINYSELLKSTKIKIFHGVSTKNFIKKGNVFFDESIKLLISKYEDKIQYTRVEDIPYNKYIDCLKDSDIILDQVYAYDQGYNALEAMSMGKVVVTGAEKEWLEYYKIKEDTIAINALPNVNYLVNKISALIENPEKIKKISINARKFIEDHHNYKSIASIYENKWINS